MITAQRRADDLAAALERHGAQVVHAPTLAVIPHADDALLLQRTEELISSPPDLVIVTTGVGLRGWIEAAQASGRAADLLDVLRGARLVARGPKAQGVIQSHGLRADWVAESETDAEIQRRLLAAGVSGQRVAVQHHGAGADGLDDAFAAAGADVVSLVVYRWGPSPDPEAVTRAAHQVATGGVDAILFTSAPGASAYLEACASAGVLEQVVAACNSEVVAAAVGDVTAAPLVAAGIRPLVPERFRMGSLVRAVVGALAGQPS